MRGRVLPVLKTAYKLFSGKGARFLGAAIAFYALLSAAPLFLLVLMIVGSVFGRGRAEEALWGGLERWVAPEGLATVRQLTERLEQVEGSRRVLGALVVVYGSTRLFRALHRALNQLWGIDLEEVDAGRKAHVKYGLRYGVGFALALFVAVMVAAIVVEKSAFAFFEVPSGVAWAIDLLTSGLGTFLLFTVLFRVLPETDVTLRESLTSALVSTVLFTLGSTLVTAYVRHKHMDDLYAGASALVLVVVWVYYSAQVFFLGACVGAALRKEQRSAMLAR